MSKAKKSARKKEKSDAVYEEDLWKKPKNKIKLGLGLLLFFTVIVYSSSIHNEILYGWDDGLYIDDSFVRYFSLSSILHFFSSYYLGMYQPLAVLTLSLDYMAVGNSPAFYHLTNLILHLFNVILVFYFIRRLCHKDEIAGIVAFLFAIHPMEVEAVGWIAARSTLLFSLFYLASLIYYLKYLEENRRKHLVLTFFLFLFSLFTKSMAVSLPLLLLLLDYYKKRKFSSLVIIEKVPFLIGSIIIGIVSIKAAASFGHIASLSGNYNFIDRIFLLSYGTALYVYKAIIPVSLSAIYGFPFKSGGTLPILYYLSFAVIVILVYLIIWSKKSHKDLGFGLLFFLLSISIVLPFYWSRFFIVAERYSYLTFIGLFYIVAHGIIYFIDLKTERSLKIKPYLIGAIVILFAWYSISTFERAKSWKNTVILMTNIIERKNSPNENISAACYYRGNYYDSQQNYQAALNDYDKAIRLNPGYMLAYNNRGIIKGTMGNFNAAINDFSKAIDLDPGYANSYFNRGLAYYQVKQTDKACLDWATASNKGFAGAKQWLDQYCK